MTTSITLPRPAADFHVHVRDGEMMKLVVPTIKQGGVSVAYIMPNLVPPLTAVEDVLAYKSRLEAVDDSITYVMSLYLSPAITPDVIHQAKKAGITGVKCYPAGVTTNSDHGVASYAPFYPTFAAMEEEDMILNLHGECPSSGHIHVLNAEQEFLPTLKDLHARFPKLRIVLEHCTSAAAVQAVKECGPTVSATITAHHLFLIIDNWAGNAYNFCKPVAKLPADREALLEAATSGNPKFFFGSDSAPHPMSAKEKGKGASAGVFTQTHAVAYVAEAFDRLGKIDKLEDFVCNFGREFYKVEEKKAGWKVVVEKTEDEVMMALGEGSSAVVPFKAGEKLAWKQTMNNSKCHAVLSPCRHIVIELLKRGHIVSGISRKPEKIGQHERYFPIPLDILGTSVTELATVLARADVVINAYGSRASDSSTYKLFVEATYQIITAFKHAALLNSSLSASAAPGCKPYLIAIGNSGSLIVPGTDGIHAVDYEPFWIEYVRSMAQSRSHVLFWKEKYPDMSQTVEVYRTAVLAWKGPGATLEQMEVMKTYEDQIANIDHDFIRACTTCYLFFDGNESFDWTFISPPAMYGPGKRTGEYDVHLENYLPLPEEEGGLLPGISAPDLAIALADEVERKGMKWTHWTLTGSQRDDAPAVIYPKI
ncbi:hypothetical protein BZA70DRAFT_312313 [Myxozyma melibiosi]|uniref:dihydroorotase n=1 Tax=Myxozyma melibiosi TaxID=54550 RepID=A0ABR1F1D9_9ASCO